MMRTVFVGGTGRSGTTVIGQLIGCHPAYALVPIETRFIVGPGGLCDLIEGRHEFPVFRRKMLGIWFDHERADGQVRGLHQIIGRRPLQRALLSLRRGLAGDAWDAGRRFVHRILDPVAAGKLGWVEMTPPNILAAPGLLQLFPDARFIHAVRDGRDVACSVVSADWGPVDLDDGLDWWASRLAESLAGGLAVPPGQLCEMRLESLVRDRREAEYARLLRFLGLEDDPTMRRFFVTEMTPARAHIGRWRRDVPREQRSAFEAHHRALAEDLAILGAAA